MLAYKDYYPEGMPMPNRNLEGDYRYKFQGQEKDPETGMEAFELRLWDGRIGRWLTKDPYGEFHSPYLGMGNNPISIIDPDGGMTDPCNCNGGFVKRLFDKIGDFFKNTFGIARFARNGNGDKWKKNYRAPYKQNKNPVSKRAFTQAITTLTSQDIQQDFNITNSLITNIERNLRNPINNTINIGGVNRQILSGQTANFPGANFFNVGSIGVRSTDGLRTGNSTLAPLTNDQVRSLINLANFMVQNPNSRVNFSFPTLDAASHPRFNRELRALYTQSFQVLTAILINNGVVNPNSRILRSNGTGFGIRLINN